METITTYHTSDSTVRPLYRGTQIVWYIFSILQTLLVLRFVLRLIGASPAAGFTQFIYTLSGILMRPFISVVSSTRFGQAVIEWNTVLAMVFYWLVAWGIVRLIVMRKPVSVVEADRKLSRQEPV